MFLLLLPGGCGSAPGPQLFSRTCSQMPDTSDFDKLTVKSPLAFGDCSYHETLSSLRVGISLQNIDRAHLVHASEKILDE